MAILLVALTSLFIFSLTPRDSVAGIEIGGTLYTGQSAYENFQFRRLAGQTLDGDAEALARLIDCPDGGGAGSYDHGTVIVQILMRVGDAKFSRMATGLEMPAKMRLAGLLASGFEYGLPKSVDFDEASLLYPLTSETIKVKKVATGGHSEYNV